MTARIPTEGPRALVSVDIETTGTNAGDWRFQVATIGLAAYGEADLAELGRRYIRLLPRAASTVQAREVLNAGWHDDPFSVWSWEPATRRWWAQQDEQTALSTFGPGGRRLTHAEAAVDLADWLASFGGPVTLAADPACFDFGPVNGILRCGAVPDESLAGLDYHCVDLRSMAFALGKRAAWLGDADPAWPLPEFESASPHHALHDAVAQGEKMCALIRLARARHEQRALPALGSGHAGGTPRMSGGTPGQRWGQAGGAQRPDETGATT